MKIAINEAAQATDAVVVVLEGRLDTVASQECAGEWAKVLELANHKIVIDMAKLEYVASSGLRLLLSLRREAQGKGGELVFKSVNAEIMQILKMTGCKDLFSYAE